MNIVINLLKVVEILCALVLIMLVLLQRSRDEGMGMAFGNAMGESLFGAQATTILTKGTIVVAIVFMVNTVVLDKLSMYGRTDGGADNFDRLLSTPAATAPAAVETAPVTSGDEGAPSIPASEIPAVPMAPLSTTPAPAPAPEAAAPAAPAPVAVPAT